MPVIQSKQLDATALLHYMRDVAKSKTFLISCATACSFTAIWMLSGSQEDSGINEKATTSFNHADQDLPVSALKVNQFANQTADLCVNQTSLFDNFSWSRDGFMSKVVDRVYSPVFSKLVQVETQNSDVSATEALAKQLATSNSLTSLFTNDASSAPDVCFAKPVGEKAKPKKMELFQPTFSAGFGVCNVSKINFVSALGNQESSEPRTSANLSARASNITESVQTESSCLNLSLRTAGGVAILGSLAFLCRHRENAPTVVATSIAATMVATQAAYRAAKQRVHNLGVDYGLWRKKMTSVVSELKAKQGAASEVPVRVVADVVEESFRSIGSATRELSSSQGDLSRVGKGRKGSPLIDLLTGRGSSASGGRQPPNAVDKAVKIAEQAKEVYQGAKKVGSAVSGVAKGVAFLLSKGAGKK